MEQLTKDFLCNLFDFVTKIYTYTKNDGANIFLREFQNLNMAKVIKKFVDVMGPYGSDLNLRNESIFLSNDQKKKQLVVFPGINMNIIWIQLNSDQKEQLWAHLQWLYTTSHLIIKEIAEKSEKSEKSENFENTNSETQIVLNNTSDKDKPLEFNPYIGVGEVNSTYGIDELFSGPQELPGQEKSLLNPQDLLTNMMPKMNINTILKTMGIDMNDLKQQLKNLDKSEIDNATNTIQSLLGNDLSPETSSLIKDMVTEVVDELKQDNAKTANGEDDFMKVAENLATKLMPKIQSSGIKSEDIWKSTMKMADNCKDKDGKPMFNMNEGPMSLLKNMMTDMQNPGAKPSMSQKEYMEQCSKMMSGMNIPGMDMSNMKNMMSMMGMGAKSSTPSATLGTAKNSHNTNNKKKKKNLTTVNTNTN